MIHYTVFDPSGNEVRLRGGSLTVIENGWRNTLRGREYEHTVPLSFAFCCTARDFAQATFGPGCSVASGTDAEGKFTRHVWDGKKWRMKKMERWDWSQMEAR